jgi:hypothetical protein
MANRQSLISQCLVAVALLGSPAYGQALVTGDLGTTLDTAFTAFRATAAFHPRRWLSLSPDVAGVVGGGGWFGLAGARATVLAGPIEASIQLARGRFDEGLNPTGVTLTGVSAAWHRGPFGVEASVREGRTTDSRHMEVSRPRGPVDTMAVSQPAETTMVGSPGRLWRDVAARIDWSAGRLGASLESGVHVEAGAQRPWWGAIEGTWSLTPRFGLVAGVASRGRTLLQGSPANGPWRLGVRMAVGRVSAPLSRRNFAAVVINRATNLTALRLYLPRAQRVELTADFLEWWVVKLGPLGGGVWEIQLLVPPGSYRVNIRMDDGPWIVPPGLPAVQDELNGQVGVLRIP